jgi:non-specific serine/threonine protein kinase/serine/threonine-protein kinase
MAGSETNVGMGSQGTVSPQRRLIDHALDQVLGQRDAVETALIPGYTIQRFIASGGMGSVYEAQQEYPRRRVALKIIRADRVSQQTRRRFEFETQALAGLQHPVIAQVFDAGMVHADGADRPYFAMEFIDGQNLNAYCLLRRLSVRDRLQLIATVCDGVEHAHQKGVIHRDLKPDNILVTKDGQPKILDFGVGRAIEPDVQLTTMETDIGKLVGTLPYMSPEQAAGDSKLLDTRSDVYSLGVVAYELLTGRRPYDLQGLPLPQVLRTIQEAEPPRLSTVNRSLRGDIETILHFALAKEKESRYGSAAALAEDIRRHLRGEPISKRPLTTWYQLAKFAARNKPLVAGIASTFAVLVLGLSTSMVLLARARHAERQQAIATAAAKNRAEDLATMTDFQASMLSDLDAEAMGYSLFSALRDGVRTALEREGRSPEDVEFALAAFEDDLRRVNPTTMAATLIDARWLRLAAESIDERFAYQPLVRAELQQTLAITYRELALFVRARPLQEAALAALKSELGDAHPKTLAAVNYMGMLLHSQGELAEAEKYLTDALTGRRRVLGDDHPDTLSSINNMGLLRDLLGRFAEAESLYREALAGRRHALGDDHPDTLRSVSNLGAALQAQDRLLEAERCYREALDGRQRVLGDDHPDTLSSFNNIAILLQALGKFDDAEPYYRMALEGRRRALGDDHPHTLNSIANMGFLLKARGKLAQAEQYYRQALAGRRRVLGDEHPDTLTSISNMGAMLLAQGRPAKAEPYCREALETRRRLLGDDHPDTLISIENMGGVFDAQGKLPEAEASYREAMDRRRRVRGNHHTDTLNSINNLGSVLFAQNRPTDAEQYLREAVEGYRRVLGEDHPDMLPSIANLGRVLQAQGKLDEAELYCREALEGCRRTLGDDHQGTLFALNYMSLLQVAQGKLDQAETTLREALDGSRRIRGNDNANTLELISNMGVLLNRQNRRQEAEPYYREALKGYRRLRGDDHPLTLQAVTNLGLFLYQQGRFDDAQTCFREALAGRRRVLGDDSPDTLSAINNLAGALIRLGRPAEAADFLTGGEAAARRVWTEDAGELADYLIALGVARCAALDFSMAEASLLEAHSLSANQRGVGALIDLYDAWHAAEPGDGHNADATAWREALSRHRQSRP